MSCRHLLIVVAAALIVPVDATCAAPAALDVVARLYNTARIPNDARDAAMTSATRTLAGSGINVSWRSCDVPDTCNRVPVVGELVIRLVRSNDMSNPNTLVLGAASIDRGAGAGVLATIYINRVELMAALSETDTAVLIGRAIAHEIGHLLLATTTHSSSGLMRAQWTPTEIQRNQSADWVLTREESLAIRKRFR